MRRERQTSFKIVTWTKQTWTKHHNTDTADQTARTGGPEMWLYWQDYSPPVQSDQLSPIGADRMSATSLSLSIYNLLLYG